MEIISTEFTENIDIFIKKHQKRKDMVKRYISKNFVENVDYIIKIIKIYNPKGGRASEMILLTKNAYDLLDISYDSRNTAMKNCKNYCSPVIMSIESATIGFISEILEDITKVEIQYKVGKYKIDCYIPEFKLAIECDERHHKYNSSKDLERQKFIENTLSCEFIRYRPEESDFKLSKVIQKILKHII